MRACSRAFACALLILATAAHQALAQISQPSQHHPATLQIGLWTLWHDRDVTLTPVPDRAATIRLCDKCTPTPLNQPTRIRASNTVLVLPDERKSISIFLSGPVTLSAHGESIALHNPVRVTARAGELILAVTLPIESYVERVVASESGPADSLESLKALAIVVRSFALHQPHGHADYDLCDSTHCQLLHWATPSPRQTAAHVATLSTAGETLWYRGARASAWFHQNCGGRTASPSEAWPQKVQGAKAQGVQMQGGEVSHQPMPWLISQSDSYCAANGARQWSTSLSLADLTAALASAGLVRPGWNTLTVARRGESGRAAMLRIGSTEVSAEDFRLAVGRALGWNKILSTWFEVSAQESAQGEQFFFHGRGSGHGVGLCQAGAAAMSAQGRNSAQILAQYFPGATVADESTGQPWQRLRSQGFVLETLSPADAEFLPQLNQALAQAESLSGLQPASTLTIRPFPSTAAFRDATLAPGWVAAFAEGDWIATQPLSTLAARKLLGPTLRHEFLHALVEAESAPSAPLWLREGLVEAWSDGRADFPRSAPTLQLDEVDRALTQASTEAASQAAHRAAAWYAQRLLNRYGRAQVLAWLHSSIPQDVLAAIR
jgi:stage II sporulation protein D